MANHDKPDTDAAGSSTEEKEPTSLQGSSEEQPPMVREDLTRPNSALEPTAQDEGLQPAPAAAHEKHTDHGLAHTMPVWMLVSVLSALLVLTFLTVSVTNYDLGSEGNFVVGMVIATVKAALVLTFFMHLYWDKKFHLILFMTAVLFVVLFLTMSLADRSENQASIDAYQNANSAAPAAK